MGGKFLASFKYSNVLNIVYVTMMYGVGMPLLFPLAALTFLNNWICERIQITYFLQIPPSLDDKLIKNAI